MEMQSQPSNNGPIHVLKETTNQRGKSRKPRVYLETSPGGASPLDQLQQGSAPVPLHPRDPQEQESHMKHSFEWCCPGMNPTTFTCSKPGTIEETLMRSSQFREIARKNKNRELVLLLEGRAISSHFPCCLVKDKRLTVKYIKKGNKHEQPVRALVRPKVKVPPSELVVFHLLTKGGKNVANITKNPALKNDFHEMSFYGYKGEKCKQALRRDGRLLSSVLKKNCLLSRMPDEVTTEMSDLIDDVDGKTFKLVRCKKSSPLDSLPSSLEDAYIETECVRSDMRDSPISEQQSATTELVKADTPKEKAKPIASKASGNMWSEMPNSKTLQKRLSEQFDHLVKGKKTQQGPKLSRIQNLFRVEFGKNTQTCREVKTMKKLMDLSASVCQVRINGREAGSGFLLFDRFVLTNCHVVRSITDESSEQHQVTVHFSFESLGQAEEGVRAKVVGSEYSKDESGHMYDWALLELSTDQNLPVALLTHFGFLPRSGGICIIGHPDGGVKKIDPCLIVPTEEQMQVVESHYRANPEMVRVDDSDYGGNRGEFLLVSDQFFGGVASSVERGRQNLTYNTCFYSGSSGSPVFDEHCKVVAMHTGGFPYSSLRGQKQSALEFGYPLSAIMEHIIIQMVERRKHDVLWEYLACNFAGQKIMATNVKRLADSRNNMKFKHEVRKALTGKALDGRLRMLFRFFAKKEEPVPMEIDRAWSS